MNSAGLIYLASPYTDPCAQVREARFLAVCRKAAELMLAGHAVFSPIAHSHCVARHLAPDLAVDGEFWMRQDIPVLRHAEALAVLKLPGWEQSKGVQWEMRLAHELMLPIWMIEP